MSKTTKIVLGAIAAVVVLLVLYVVGTYNSLVTLNENTDLKWGNVEVQYQRRLDVIDQLVNAVKAALKQEQTVLGKIADARTKYAGATTVENKVQAANETETALARLLVVMENYPQLNSLQNIKDLQAELVGTANRISTEQMRFNEAVAAYNIKVKSFPSNTVAGTFGFENRTMFKADMGANKAPKVNLDL